MKHTLAVVIITYNEESNIERCLQSVMGIADEIVVIDSFSTDTTEKICKKYNVNFISRKWEGYSSAKNFGNAQVKSTFILSLDADEVLSSELRNSILFEKEYLSGAYSFNRLTNYAGKWIKHCGWYPDKKIRIFAKDQAMWVGDFVHETLELSENTKIQHLAGDLLHFSFKSTEDHLRRSIKYAQLNAEKLKQKGVKYFFLKPYLNSFFRFFKDFVLNKGFLDGKEGFKICKISAYAVFLKYKYLRNL